MLFMKVSLHKILEILKQNASIICWDEIFQHPTIVFLTYKGFGSKAWNLLSHFLKDPHQLIGMYNFMAFSSARCVAWTSDKGAYCYKIPNKNHINILKANITISENSKKNSNVDMLMFSQVQFL